VLLGVPPATPETLTPAQARKRYGVLPPTEEYARFREHVAAKAAARSGAENQPLVGPELPESIAALGPVG
jgi:hypothetical protein